MSKKLEAFALIEKSKAFAQAELSIKILKYLVEADEKGMKPSSAQLAYDVLGKDGDMYKDQVSFIRVQVHHIRKKLKVYYLSEGKNDPVQISIPKGNYQIQCTETETAEAVPSKQKGKKKSLTVLMLLGFVAVLLVVVAVMGVKMTTNVFQDKKAPVSEIISSLIIDEKPLAIVLGNRDFYREYDKDLNRVRYIWDSDNRLPHQEGAMSKLIRAYPEKQITTYSGSYKMTHTEVDHMLFASRITNRLYSQNKNFQIKLATSIVEVEQPVVFLGKMGDGDMYKLKRHFKNTRFKFNQINDPKAIGVKLNTFLTHDKQLMDINPRGGMKHYFIIKKVTLTNGYPVLYLLSNQTSTRDYIYNKFFDPSFSQLILDEVGDVEIPSYELLIEVNLDKNAHHIYYSSLRKEEQE